jgi:hypothetical protein
VLPVELVVHFPNGGIEEDDRSVDAQLYQRNSCSLDELNLCDPGLSLKQFFQPFQGSLDPFRLR